MPAVSPLLTLTKLEGRPPARRIAEHVQSAPRELIAVGYELEPFEVLCACNNDRSRCTAKHTDLALPSIVDAEVRPSGPIGICRIPGSSATAGDAVANAVETIPDLDELTTVRYEYVDLIEDAKLQRASAERRADRRSIVDKCSVLKELVVATFHWRQIDRAIKCQLPVDIDKIVQGPARHTRIAKFEIADRCRVQQKVSINRQCAWARAGCQYAGIPYSDVTANHTGTAQRCTGIHRNKTCAATKCADGIAHEEPSGRDRRVASVAVTIAGKGQPSRAIFGETGSSDERTGVGLVERLGYSQIGIQIDGAADTR